MFDTSTNFDVPISDRARRFRSVLGLVLASGIACSTAFLETAPVAAQQDAACGAEVITAHGEPSRYEWLAKTKARANWRRRVRGLPGLGPNYADWKHAADQTMSCISGTAGSVCTISGIPCR